MIKRMPHSAKGCQEKSLVEQRNFLAYRPSQYTYSMVVRDNTIKHQLAQPLEMSFIRLFFLYVA